MDEKDVKTHVAIREAIKAGDLEQVQQLIDEDRSRLTMDTPFGSWLHIAAAKGQVDIARWLVNQGMDLNLRSGIEESAPIHCAAADGHVEIVNLLLEHGAELHTDSAQVNPLFGAALGGHLAIAMRLIEHGIDHAIVYPLAGSDGMTASDLAREYGQTEVADYLDSLDAE